MDLNGASMYLACTPGKLRDDKGVLSVIDPRRSNDLSKATLDHVELFTMRMNLRGSCTKECVVLGGMSTRKID